ncbi:hypothetical protein B0H19DRAFT_1074122 [Mycena capillaripes]|nr:hypothetical protein B0H19DRAFT_1074122 [Mycena capillaripes]
MAVNIRVDYSGDCVARRVAVTYLTVTGRRVFISRIGLLSMLWVATGVVVQISSSGLFSGCGATDDTDDFIDLSDAIDDPLTCQETSVVEAFAFLNGLILIVYVGTLIVVSLLASRRKHIGVTSSIASASSSEFKAPMPNSYTPHLAVHNAGVQAKAVHV